MIAAILAQKIVSLYIMIFCGFLLVRTGLLRPEQSRVLSVLSIYLVTPCVILEAFQIEFSPAIRDGLLLSLASAVGIHIILIALNPPLRRMLHLDAVEQASMLYSNSGNLIVPLVAMMFGGEWLIYASVFMCVQLLPMWSHGKGILSGEKGFEPKKMLLNINIIATAAGIVILFSGFRFPGVVDTSLNAIAATVGPVNMLVTGMLIAGLDARSYLRRLRLWLVVFLRLIGLPLVILAVMALTHAAYLVENGTQILLISFLAAISPPASSVTQMAQVYDNDALYASAINVAGTLCCIATMPAMIWLFSAVI